MSKVKYHRPGYDDDRTQMTSQEARGVFRKTVEANKVKILTPAQVREQERENAAWRKPPGCL
jgi:hypothetical protein